MVSVASVAACDARVSRPPYLKQAYREGWCQNIEQSPLEQYWKFYFQKISPCSLRCGIEIENQDGCTQRSWYQHLSKQSTVF